MIEPRSIETERVVVALRWISLTVILVLAHFVPAEEVDLPLVYRLILAGTIYNLIYMGLLRLRFLPSFLSDLTVLAELIFIAALVYATGGTGSQLLPFAILPVITAAFRLGLRQSLATAALSSLFYFSFIFFNLAHRVEWEHLSRVAFGAVYFFLAAVLGNILGSHERRIAERGLAQERQTAQEATVKLQALSAQAQAIAEVSSILSSTLNYERVMETILSEFHKLLGFNVGIVFLFDRQGGELRVAAERGLTLADRLVRLQPGEGVIGQVIRQGDPLLITNPTKDEDLRHLASLAEIRCALCVPLRAGFEMYGAVLIASKEKDAYAPEHLDLLLAFGNQAVIAMHNAQLYQSLRQERDRVVEDEEEARKRLARDLHDGPVQVVAAIAMKAEVVKRAVAADPSKAAEEMDALAELARKASQDLRTVLFELRPVMLESQGLLPTLGEYVKKMRDTQKAPLRLDGGGFSQRLPPKTESTIFTIVQEAVNNALKHASAKTIWLRLAERGKTLVVTVEDDGKGFDQASVEGSYSQRGSLGLLNMRERAEMVDGILNIRSIPGFGTTVTLRIPLEDEAQTTMTDSRPPAAERSGGGGGLSVA